MGIEEFVVGGVAAGTLVSLGTQIVKRVFEIEGRCAELTTLVIAMITVGAAVIGEMEDPATVQEWAILFGTWWAGTILVTGFAMGLYAKLSRGVEPLQLVDSEGVRVRVN